MRGAVLTGDERAARVQGPGLIGKAPTWTVT